MQKSLSMKKIERNERRKKKLAALATIIELNDRDRLARAQSSQNSSSTETTNSDGESDTFTKVSSKNLKNKTSGNESGATSGDDTNSRISFNKALPQKVSNKKLKKKKRGNESGGTSGNDTDNSKVSPNKPENVEHQPFPMIKVASKRDKNRKLVLDPLNGSDHERVGKKHTANKDDGSIPNKRARLNSSCSEDVESNNSDEKEKGVVVISDGQYKNIKQMLRKRKYELTVYPIFRLKEPGAKALITSPPAGKTPIFLTDIQHLVMAALLGKHSPCSPGRWCHFDPGNILCHTMVLLIEGCALFHYYSNESKFERTKQIFETKLEMIMPPYKPNSMIEELLKVPLTNIQASELIDKYGSLEAAVEMIQDPTLLVSRIFNIKPDNESQWLNESLHPDDKFPRTKLLLSALQMVDEGYPLPMSGEFETRFSSFIMTKDQYKPVTNKSPLFGLDCEMCFTTVGYNELTRISIVNENFETVYETLVRPVNNIIDYLTQYSGITKEIMEPVTKTLKDVQREVRALLPEDAILVGQSLQSDLTAMQMMHPYVIDTSVCFNITGNRKRKSKLQKLALTFLKEAIQEKSEGHDSVEDSIATLKLVKLKLANSIEYGDQILADRKRFQDILKAYKEKTIQNNMLACVAKVQKNTAIVSAVPIEESLKKTIEETQSRMQSKLVSIDEADSNKDAIQKARKLLAGDSDLVIANINIAPEELRLESCDNTIQMLDKWISKIWKSMDTNSLFVVLMGGTTECPNGLAQIAIKRPFIAATDHKSSS